MKKFFAVVLAVVMAMSMASVSFAELCVSSTPLDFVADTNYMRDDVTKIQYGDTVYFNIWDEADYSDNDFGGDGIANYKFMEKTKIKTTFEMGEDLVESVNLVKMPASIMGAPEFTEYFIAVKLFAVNLKETPIFPVGLADKGAVLFIDPVKWVGNQAVVR